MGKVYFENKLYAYGEDVEFDFSKYYSGNRLFVEGVGIEGLVARNRR